MAMTRRALLGGALVVGGVGLMRPALAAPAASSAGWLGYEARLRDRLRDAGGGAFDAGFARTLLTQNNSFRAAQGLAPYRWHEGLAACARAHAADMAARRYFAHESPEGFTHLDRVSLLSRDLCGETAENLAWREYPTASVPAQFEQMWEQSAGHRRNLLRPNYSVAGYGVVRIGATYFAAGVYADPQVELARPAPLAVAPGEDLSAMLDGARPVVERAALTAPFKTPASIPPAGRLAAAQSGVWQLRPLRPVGEGRYQVLAGPMVFVG